LYGPRFLGGLASSIIATMSAISISYTSQTSGHCWGNACSKFVCREDVYHLLAKEFVKAE
jgi:hypothetical protein